MTIYLLRHEKRDINDPTFYSHLLKSGRADAENLKYEIEQLNIDIIFSSPFIRTLQTIEPYCFYKKQKVNIENGLYEHISPQFDKNMYKFDLGKITFYNHLINYNYKSLITLDQIKYDSIEAVVSNTLEFKKHLLETYKDGENILLVTHLSVINAFLERDINTHLDMGKVISFAAMPV